MLRTAAKWLAIAGAVIAVLVGALYVRNRFRLPDVPLPDAAIEPVFSYGPLAFSKHLSFEVTEAYPGHSVRDFYARWAQENGWEKVEATEESWSADEWQRFEDSTTVPPRTIDQWLVHWASPERELSLRVALRYESNSEDSERKVQEVHVMIQPFDVLG